MPKQTGEQNMYCNRNTGELVSYEDAYEGVPFNAANHPIKGLYVPLFQDSDELCEWCLDNGHKASHSCTFNRTLLTALLAEDSVLVSRAVLMFQKIERINVCFYSWKELADLWQVCEKTCRRNLKKMEAMGVCVFSTERVMAKSTVRVTVNPDVFCIGYDSYRKEDWLATQPLEVRVEAPRETHKSFSKSSGMSAYLDYETRSYAYQQALMEQAEVRSDVVKRCNELEFSMLLNGEIDMSNLVGKYYKQMDTSKY